MTRPVPSLSADFASGTADLTPYGREPGFTITRGTSQLVTTGFVADPGTFSSPLDNISRALDPNYLAGPYVTAGETDVVPGVPVFAETTWNATIYSLFAGRADGWPQSYPLNGKDQLVDFSATDAIGFFGGAQIYQPGLPAQYSGERIQAIVSLLGWGGSTNIAHGNCIVGPLQYGTISAWSHLSDVAMAEWGELFVTADGTLTFRDRDTILSETRSTVSQATFSDLTGLRYSGRTMISPDIVNDAVVTFNDRGSQVLYQDATSIAAPWGLRSINKSLPIQTVSQAQQYARWLVTRYGSPLTTFGSITLTPSNEPGATYELWVQALSRELGDLITVVGDPLKQNPTTHVIAPSGVPITRLCWIRGIEHHFESQPWSTTFRLQDASWITGLFILDSSLLDGADVLAW